MCCRSWCAISEADQSAMNQFNLRMTISKVMKQHAKPVQKLGMKLWIIHFNQFARFIPETRPEGIRIHWSQLTCSIRISQSKRYLMICKDNGKYAKGQQRNFAPSTLMVIWFPTKFYSSNFMLLLTINQLSRSLKKRGEINTLGILLQLTGGGDFSANTIHIWARCFGFSKARYKSAKM